jgi:hypothetical protein
MGGENPVESAKLVHVSTLAFTQQEAVKSSIFAEESRWSQREDELEAKGLKPTDQRWQSAQEVHELLIASYKQQLKLLQKVGNPRGL